MFTAAKNCSFAKIFEEKKFEVSGFEKSVEKLV
jgi:hypothetical protein